MTRKKAMLRGIWIILLLCLLLPYAGAAAKITCVNDATEVITGAGTPRNPWVVTVGNTYTVSSGEELKSSTCLDANWYILGDNKNYLEIVGADFNTVEPKVKAIAATGDKNAQLKFTHQVYQPENGDANVWTAADYYYFRIEEPQAAAEPEKPAEPATKPTPTPTPTPTPNTEPAGGVVNQPPAVEPDPEPAPDNTPPDNTTPSSGVPDSSGSSDAPGGTCDDALTWQVDGDTLTIRGSGEMDLHFTDAPWYEYRRDIKTVTIVPGVTTVDYAAFRDFKVLDAVLIPNSVTDLGSDVFLRCAALEYIILPDGLTEIPSTLFANCTSLKSLDIPKAVKKIGMFAFQKCTSLESISIPASVKRIESTAFIDCTGLQDVYYDGTAAQWAQIDIGSDNEALTQAVLHTSDNPKGSAPASSTPASSGASSSAPSDAKDTSSASPASPSSSTPSSSAPSDAKDTSPASPASSASSTPATSTSTVPAVSLSSTTGVHGNAWYAPAMEWAYTSSIINDADYHAPLSSCPRSSIVLYLWRAKGCPAAKSQHTFHDLSSGALYYDAVQWAVEAGLITGFQDGSFRPTGTLTRAQLVTILHRLSGSGKATDSVSFADVPKGAWYTDSIQWAVSNNITKGTSASEFSPNGTCTIAQVLTFLQRLFSSAA